MDPCLVFSFTVAIKSAKNTHLVASAGIQTLNLLIVGLPP